MFNLYLLFPDKVLPLLSNANDAVSSNDKDEVDTMKAVVPKLSNAATYYESHCLHSNFQFSEIDTIMQSMRTESSIVYMVTYHKQKVLHMRFHKGRVD